MQHKLLCLQYKLFTLLSSYLLPQLGRLDHMTHSSFLFDYLPVFAEALDSRIELTIQR
jgi:hypothetical protein